MADPLLPRAGFAHWTFDVGCSVLDVLPSHVYLQPWMLWVLPAALLPIVIHLLNRLRYKTVPWAAMIFLLKANRAATRRAKIRQYLLLACRVLVLLFLHLGDGAAAHGRMDRRGGRRCAGSGDDAARPIGEHGGVAARRGKQAGARARASRASGEAERRQPIRLLENVLRQPIEIAGARRWKPCNSRDQRTRAPIFPRCCARLDYLVANKPAARSCGWRAICRRATGSPTARNGRISPRVSRGSRRKCACAFSISHTPGRNVSWQ
jgi:hypothetical protein